MTNTDKCDICNQIVLDTQDALLCEKCNIWKHRTCMSISSRTYTQMSKSREPWYCTKCKSDDRKQSKTYTINDVMTKLDEMNAKYNALYMKFEEQLKTNERLQKELVDIKKQLNKKDQKELKNNFVIQGIPYQQNENLPEIITKIGQNLGVSTGKYTAFRFAKQGDKDGAIKVKFEDENIKKDMLKSKKKFALQCQDLGYNKNNKIYLNHDLTRANLQLFKEARNFKTRHGFKYLWFSNGNILLRKEDNSKIIQVEDLEQLEE